MSSMNIINFAKTKEFLTKIEPNTSNKYSIKYNNIPNINADGEFDKETIYNLNFIAKIYKQKGQHVKSVKLINNVYKRTLILPP